MGAAEALEAAGAPPSGAPEGLVQPATAAAMHDTTTSTRERGDTRERGYHGCVIMIATAPRSARPHAAALAIALASLASGVRADERRPAPDPRELFAPGGVLSPGYVDAHARSTAKPLDLVTPEGRAPRVAVVFNPALAPLGKWAGRLEVAPFRAHALFVELSSVRLDTGDTRVDGTEIDIGYHLFPLGDGLAGLYLGPRWVRGTGQSDVARGTATGWGGDIGFQWVVGPIAINFGAGVAYAHFVIDPKLELITSPDVSPEVKAQIPKQVDTWQILPLATAGLGFAF